MSSDVELIVKAIEGLQSNVYNDYIFPLGTVLVSGLLGAGVAYYSINRQEKTRIEIDKINSLNKTILSVEEIRKRLISIKENYIGKISEHPINRMTNIPPIILNEEKVDINIVQLSFLAPDKKVSKVKKWESISYISTLFSNFDFLIRIWAKRNEIILDSRSKFEPYFSTPLSFKDIENLIGKSNTFQLIDFTELALMMTDELLIETSNFLTEFPITAKAQVEEKTLKKFGNIIKVVLPDSNTRFVKKVPSVDINLLSQIQGISVKELTKRYRPLYTNETNKANSADAKSCAAD